MGKYTILKNLYCIDPDLPENELLDVMIDENSGLIIKIGEDLFIEDARIINDYQGLTAFPGFIDPHVHFRYPGNDLPEDWLTGSKAAIAGGVTTVLEMPNTTPPTTDEKGLKIKIDHVEKNTLVNYGLFGGFTGSNFEFLAETPEIKAIKVYLASTTGTLLVESPEKTPFKNTDKIFCFHSEDEATIRNNEKQYPVLENPVNHSRQRSEEAAIISTKKLIELHKRSEANFHVAHLSTDFEIELLKDTTITYEVAPHHIFLNTGHYASLQYLIKCNPPVRSKETAEKIYQRLIHGEIPMIATDHAPHKLEKKKLSPDNPKFIPASGLPSLEAGTHFILSEVAKNSITPDAARKMLSTNCAERFRINKRGRLLAGFYADLAMVDLKKQWTFSKNDCMNGAGWSPFTGFDFSARVEATFVNGKEYKRENLASSVVDNTRKVNMV